MIAAPPGMKKGDILDTLLDMEGQNKDGFGFGFLDKNKKFQIKKTSMSLSEVLKKKSHADFFGKCFNHDGWVLFHMRKASRGAVCINNAHPFISKDTLFCHNGTLPSAFLLKELLGKEYKYTSSTDSEVALHLYDKLKVAKFTDYLFDAGVFFALNREGNLTVVKTNYAADLKVGKLYPNTDSKKVFLASTLPHKSDWEDYEFQPGYSIFNPYGEELKYVKKEIHFNNTSRQWNENTNPYYDGDCCGHNSAIKSHTVYPKKIEAQNTHVSSSVSKHISGMTDEDYRMQALVEQYAG